MQAWFTKRCLPFDTTSRKDIASFYTCRKVQSHPPSIGWVVMDEVDQRAGQGRQVLFPVQRHRSLFAVSELVPMMESKSNEMMLDLMRGLAEAWWR